MMKTNLFSNSKCAIEKTEHKSFAVVVATLSRRGQRTPPPPIVREIAGNRFARATRVTLCGSDWKKRSICRDQSTGCRTRATYCATAPLTFAVGHNRG